MARRLRLLHTADWHLGHTLREDPRDFEHACFLDWLLQTLEEREVDALLVAGDVFHTSNPPASAQKAWYSFLAELHRRLPELTVVVVAGNHDSAARLEAPEALLRAMRVHLVGGLPRLGREALDLERLVVPLLGSDGQVRARLAAIPFLRPLDLRGAPGDSDPVIPATRRIYDAVLGECARRAGPGEALLAMGHCYMVGGQVSELSERRVQVGNQLALPADIFPETVAYVALGHLHRAQRVGGRDQVRYSGSPIPLSMDEARYCQHVLLVDLEEGGLADLQALEVPRSRELMRLPEQGPQALEQVLELIRALPPADGLPEARRPLLEVLLRLERPQPEAQQQIEEALEGRAPRLIRLGVSYTGSGADLVEAQPQRSLSELQPDEVFRRCYERSHQGEPPAELLAAFHELLESVQGEPE